MSFLYTFPNPKPGKLPPNTVGVVAHGGGGKAFGNTHPLVQFLHNYVDSVVSIELPNHGNREKSDKFELNPLEAVKDLKEKLTPLVTGKKVFFMGYSLGGILLFHLQPYFQQIIDPQSIAVFIGIGIRPNLKNWNLISEFWTVEYFMNTKGDGNMLKLHGPNWHQTVRTAHKYMEPDSPLWLPQDVRRSLFDIDKPNIFFVAGAEIAKEPFDVEDIADDMDKRNIALRIISIPCGHWTYFSQHWYIVQQTLATIVLMYGNLPQPSSKL